MVDEKNEEIAQLIDALGEEFEKGAAYPRTFPSYKLICMYKGINGYELKNEKDKDGFISQLKEALWNEKKSMNVREGIAYVLKNIGGKAEEISKIFEERQEFEKEDMKDGVLKYAEEEKFEKECMKDGVPTDEGIRIAGGEYIYRETGSALTTEDMKTMASFQAVMEYVNKQRNKDVAGNGKNPSAKDKGEKPRGRFMRR
jgi:hypothetical protein